MRATTLLTRAASVWTYPLTPTDFLASLSPRHSSRQLRGVVTAMRPETPGVTTIEFRPGPGWTPHVAGQWARVGVQIDGAWHWRPFSISTPQGAAPAITVGSVGVVSEALQHARVGDVVLLDQPQGEFTLPDRLGPALFLAAGTGITPIYAQVATLLARDPGADAVVVHVARTDVDALFDDRLAALAAKHPGLRVHSWRSSASGRLDLTTPDALAALVPDWAQRTAFVCGPAALIADAEALVKDAGHGEVHVERFTLTRRVDPNASGGRVSLVTSGVELDVEPGTSVLEAAEASGLALKSGCRMGICRTCVCKLQDGQVRDLVTGEVHGEPGDYVRVCVSSPAGDVRLEA